MSWTLSGRWAESPTSSDISNQGISRVAVSTMTNLPSDEVEPSRKPCDHDERRSHLRQRYQMPTIPAKYCDESEQNEHPTQSTDRVVPNHTKVATTSSQHVLKQKFDQQTKRLARFLTRSLGVKRRGPTGRRILDGSPTIDTTICSDNNSSSYPSTHQSDGTDIDENMTSC